MTRRPAPPVARTARALAAALLLELGMGMGGMAAAQATAWVTNQGSHDVSVIDLASLRELARVPVGRSPAGVVAVPVRGRVYVANPDSRDVAVLDQRSHRLLARLPAGLGPVGIDASADGRWLHVVDWYARELLTWDLDSTAPGQPAHHRTALGQAPAGVAAAGGSLAWVAERDDDQLALVDAQAQRVLARVAVGRHPFAVLLDAPRQRLYALNVESDDVSVIDTARRRLIATVPVGKAPYGAALAHGGRLLYITNQHDDSVSVLDAQTLAPVRTLTGFGYPEGVAAQGDRVYVVNWMDERLSVLDAPSGRLIAQVPTGRNPRGFGAFIGVLPP